MRRFSIFAIVSMLMGLLATMSVAGPAAADTLGISHTIMNIANSADTDALTTAHYGQQALFRNFVQDRSGSCTRLIAPSCDQPDGTVELHIGDPFHTPAFASTTLIHDQFNDFESIAYIRWAGLAPGHYTNLFARYVPGGANVFDQSASDPQTLDVTAEGTSTALSQSSTTDVVGSGPDLTATVTPNDAPDTAHGAVKPGGQVQFLDNGNPLGNSNVDSGTGQAIYHAGALPAGSHSLTVKYLGDTNYTGSTSSAVSHSISQGGTTNTLSTTTTHVVYGQAYTVTDQVAAVSPANGVPTGDVSLTDAFDSSGETTGLIGGSKDFSLPNGSSSADVGSHVFTSSYSGDTNFTGSTSNQLTVVIAKANTLTTLSSSANPASVGQGVTITATVAVVSPGAGSPSGTVQFKDGSVSLGAPKTLSSGAATFTSAALAGGGHSITAVYSGDGNFNGSTGTLTQTITCDHTVSASSGNLTLASGTTCVTGGNISGTVTVPAGAKLSLFNTIVGGSIVSSNGASAVTICGSNVGSAVTISNSTGFVLLGDPFNDICAANTFRSSITLTNNHGAVELAGNRVQGAVKATGNSGTGPPPDAGTEIEGNTISSGLNCSGNTPAAVDDGRLNTVAGARSGECLGSF